MIFNRITGIQRLFTPLTKVSINRFNNCMAFSTIKQKAEKYLCAAVAYRTLSDVDPNQLYCLKSNSEKKNQTVLLQQSAKKNKYDLFSLREKVIHNINILKLSQEQSREQIRKIFETQHGLVIRQSIKTTRLQQGGKRKSSEYQLNFSFNPTLLFKEFDQKIAQHKLRKVYVGKFGIGKSSNQLLIAHLTHIAFMFRKEGKTAQDQLETLLKKNQKVLKKIIPITSFEAQNIKNKKDTFIETVKKKFYQIPFIYFYSLPEAITSQFIPLNYMGYRMEDFLEYFSEEQLKKFKITEPILSLEQQRVAELDYQWLQKIIERKFSTLQKVMRFNNENTQNFLRALQLQCKQKHIKFTLVIDQINLLFKNVRIQEELKQIFNNPQLLKKSQLNQKAITDLLNNSINLSSLYSQILDQMHVSLPYANIILTASANVQWATKAQQSQKNYFPGKNAQLFFNKQVSITKSRIIYSRQCHTELWQKQMDVVLLFQTERKIYELLAALNQQELPNNYLAETKQMFKKLRSLFHKQMAKVKSQTQKWSYQTRHLFIRQCFEQDEGQIENMFKSILQWLKLHQQFENKYSKKDLQKKLLQKLKKLKLTFKPKIENLYLKYLSRQKTKGMNMSEVYNKQLFYLQLYNAVDKMPQNKSNENQVIIKGELFKELLIGSNIPQDDKLAYLDLLINKDYQQIIQIEGEKALRNICSLKDLKQRLRSLTQNVQFRVFIPFTFYQLIQADLNQEI